MLGVRVREKLQVQVDPRFYVELLLETAAEFTNTTDFNYSHFEAEVECPLAV